MNITKFMVTCKDCVPLFLRRNGRQLKQEETLARSGQWEKCMQSGTVFLLLLLVQFLS